MLCAALWLLLWIGTRMVCGIYARQRGWLLQLVYLWLCWMRDRMIGQGSPACNLHSPTMSVSKQQQQHMSIFEHASAVEPC